MTTLTRTVSGLSFQETFNPGSSWSGVNWSIAADPAYVISPRSPIVHLAPTVSGSDEGGIREVTPFIDSDGTWWTFYGAGTGSNGWTVQCASSTDRGLNWTKHGPTDFGLQKTSSPIEGSYGCRDMLWLAKFGSTYHLHPMSGSLQGSPPYVAPNSPYESDCFTAPSLLGPWTWQRKSGVNGASGTFNDEVSIIACQVLDGSTWRNFYSIKKFGDSRAPSGLGSSSLPEGPYTMPTGDINYEYGGEDSHTFYSNFLGKYVTLVNNITPNAVASDMSYAVVSPSLTDWSVTRKHYIQGAREDQGQWGTGQLTPFYLPEATVLETNEGYIPVSYDTDSADYANDGDYFVFINHHSLRWGTLEPSTHAAQYDPGTVVFTEDFNRSNRSIEADNGWHQPYGATTVVISSGLLDFSDTPEDTIAVQTGVTATDVAVEADITAGTDCGVDIILRYQNQNSFYIVTFVSSGSAGDLICRFFKKTGVATYVQIGTDVPTWYKRGFGQGSVHRCKATIVGNTISAFLEGFYVYSVTDSDISSGGPIGFRNDGGGAGTRHVDNVVVRDLGTATSDRFSKTYSHTDFIAEYSLTLQDLLAAGAAGIDYRIQAGGDSYRLALPASGGLVLYKSTGGSGGVPGSYSSLASSSGSQEAIIGYKHRIRVEVSGNVHKAWLDGEAQIDYTDSSSPYTSGVSLAFVATGVTAQVRNFHVRSSNDLTINGLTNGDTITLRMPGGVPWETGTASGTSHTFSDIPHYPMGSVEINGFDIVSSSLFWGGDTWTYNTSGTVFNTSYVFNPRIFNKTHTFGVVFNTKHIFNRNIFNPTQRGGNPPIDGVFGDPFTEGMLR